MWLARQLAAVRASDEPLVLTGGEPCGVPFVIDALREHEQVAWFGIGAAAQGDPVAQGNALARAVNRVLAASLLPLALPYRAHLQTLDRHRHDLLPLWLVVTADALEAAFLDDLLDLHRHGYRLLVDLRATVSPNDGPLQRCRILDEAALRVRVDEARAALPAALSDAVVADLVSASGGRYGTLSALAQRAAGLPRHLVPTPQGPLLDVAEAELVEPSLAVLALRREGDLVAALELAVLRAPHLVEELLRTAGPRYQEEGLLTRLHVLLSALPESLGGRERVLEWRLVAALAAGDLAVVAPAVDAHLHAHSAPALRARRAGTVPHARGFGLAQASVQTARTPLTLWQYGRLHPNPESALELLRESVQVADEVGTPYEVARNAASLAAKLNHVGAFARAAAWGRWALDVFDQEHLQDGARRYSIVNDLAVARILSGDVAGLRQVLEDAQTAVEGSLPGLAARLRSTLAYLELAEGRPAAALPHLEATYRASPRRTRARYAYQLVRVLNELGRSVEAAAVAADAVEIAAGDEPHERLEGSLARGMAQAYSGDPAAVDHLLEVMLAGPLVMEQRLSAALHYLLVAPGAAHILPEDVAKVLRALHPNALRVFSGSAARFGAIWATLASSVPELQIDFLGGPRCRFGGRDVTLPPRLAEAALALVLHPDGIGREQLNAFLTPVGQAAFSPGGMRGTLTRLRALLPVSDAPYRFTVPYRSDVLEARAQLVNGRVREAVTLLRGRLLPESEAPGVEEQRLVLEEELRQAAFQAADGDALFDLAERLGDDIECWLATAEALATGDPRVALARARVRRLERDFGSPSW